MVASGEVLDFTGGRADLESGLVRAIGDPETRFKEDHLRMLRAVRFAARLGFELLDESRLLGTLLPEIAAMKGVPQPPEFHPEGDVWTHVLLMLERMRSPSRTLAVAVLSRC